MSFSLGKARQVLMYSQASAGHQTYSAPPETFKYTRANTSAQAHQQKYVSASTPMQTHQIKVVVKQSNTQGYHHLTPGNVHAIRDKTAPCSHIISPESSTQ